MSEGTGWLEHFQLSIKMVIIKLAPDSKSNETIVLWSLVMGVGAAPPLVRTTVPPGKNLGSETWERTWDLGTPLWTDTHL